MLTELEKKIVREFQSDLPLCSHPFKVIAEQIGTNEDELLAEIHRLKQLGIIRRFGAIVNHRNIGIAANAMVVWRVPKEKSREIGEIMATFPEVTHCYERPTYPDWQYNLFTMIHGESKDECERIIAQISERTGVRDYKQLYSTQELKKVSMKYFSEM
ncbi:TPA: Lrp/AsnC family transcriptional regulator [Candidatus Poribacteria bacterium]|nr:Lrp/AsnC family transcriptional regulator [Candidatus Poribacteria bacterium]